jgi:hypothetical protein
MSNHILVHLNHSLLLNFMFINFHLSDVQLEVAFQPVGRCEIGEELKELRV